MYVYEHVHSDRFGPPYKHAARNSHHCSRFLSTGNKPPTRQTSRSSQAGRDMYRVSFSCWQQEIPTIATVSSGDISAESPSRAFQMTTQRPKCEDRPLRVLVILPCLARFRLPESCYCNRTKNCVSLASISFFFFFLRGGGRGEESGSESVGV